jgi:GntR family transcriptional regulator / MocR family aminotransferase
MGELGDLVVDLEQRGERTTAVYRALLDAIRSGRLQGGERLPATRALAADLGVSRTTVAGAYDRLVAEGFLTARVGAGTYVATAARPSPPPRGAGELVPRASWSAAAPAPTSGLVERPEHDFRVGLPDAGLFPFDTWRRLVTAELRLGAHDLGTYADPAGHAGLREQLVRHLALARGLRATPEEVTVTHGTQQALDLVARVLLEPGDVVAVEDPGYLGARQVFEAHGARVVPVPVDEDGLRVEQVPRAARLVFTTPSHQFPFGPPLSQDRRLALLERAAANGTAVVEDDYDSEFRFTERPLETLHSLDRAGRVIYLGTFSKSLVPGLRVGYLVAPEPLQGPLRAALQLSVGHRSVPEQAALARFLGDGLYARHLRRARSTYGERRALVVEQVEGPLAEWLELVPCQAGLHVTTLLRDPAASDTAVAVRAAEAGVVVEPLSAYAVADPRPGLVIGYGAARTESITPGLRRLGRVLGGSTGARRGRRGPGRAAADR